MMSDLSDFELNKAIAEALYPGCNVTPFDGNDSTIWVRSKNPLFIRDYVNNWNDLMPLVVEYGIEYFRSSIYGQEPKEYIAEYDPVNPEKPSIRAKSTSIRRALAECLLKVLESK